jgi:uncharacterized protein YcbX
MLVDEQQQFLSQRRVVKMALIRTALTDRQLILSAHGMDNLILPLETEPSDEILINIWRDRCSARTVSADADQWLSDYLQLKCQLVYQADDCIRVVDPHYAQPYDQVSWADAFPFLLIAEASLAALNAAMGLNLSMQRFRPNLVIANCAAYAEDYWREIQIGKIEFRLPKPCSRCAVPAIDPETAQLGKEPLATLNRLRKWQNKLYFGQNALPNNLGLLTVGDRVTVTQLGEPQPPLNQ